MKTLLMLILIFFISIKIHAQSWRPVFLLPLGAELLLNINNKNLNEYLNMNVPRHRPGSCEVELSVFHFRVNSQGKIDSVCVDGNLSKEVSAQIVKNIYKTERKWKIPDNPKANDKCWFVYPFFLFGNSRPCSESKRVAYRQMHIIYEMYSETADTRDNLGRVILSPNSFAIMNEK